LADFEAKRDPGSESIEALRGNSDAANSRRIWLMAGSSHGLATGFLRLPSALGPVVLFTIV